MTIKEQLFIAMERIASTGIHKSVTLVILCEADTDKFCSMVGFRNEKGAGTVLHIHATRETIARLTEEIWNVSNNIQDGNRNPQQ